MISALFFMLTSFLFTGSESCGAFHDNHDCYSSSSVIITPTIIIAVSMNYAYVLF